MDFLQKGRTLERSGKFSHSQKQTKKAVVKQSLFSKTMPEPTRPIKHLSKCAGRFCSTASRDYTISLVPFWEGWNSKQKKKCVLDWTSHKKNKYITMSVVSFVLSVLKKKVSVNHERPFYTKNYTVCSLQNTHKKNLKNVVFI